MYVIESSTTRGPSLDTFGNQTTRFHFFLPAQGRKRSLLVASTRSDKCCNEQKYRAALRINDRKDLHPKKKKKKKRKKNLFALFWLSRELANMAKGHFVVSPAEYKQSPFHHLMLVAKKTLKQQGKNAIRKSPSR